MVPMDAKTMSVQLPNFLSDLKNRTARLAWLRARVQEIEARVKALREEAEQMKTEASMLGPAIKNGRDDVLEICAKLGLSAEDCLRDIPVE
jgi:hypothetical protein